MQAYYEIETQISNNHQLHIQLPDSIPAGLAKIAIIYEVSEWQKPSKKALMLEFLDNLPELKTQGLSREQIQTYLNEERAAWDN